MSENQGNPLSVVVDNIIETFIELQRLLSSMFYVRTLINDSICYPKKFTLTIENGKQKIVYIEEPAYKCEVLLEIQNPINATIFIFNNEKCKAHMKEQIEHFIEIEVQPIDITFFIFNEEIYTAVCLVSEYLKFEAIL